ncbi:pilus biosynthesis protein [Psychromonas marina]|uniref:Pilus biosynthesis protein n=1 Tax=Psychromonas marina TaxID=88364 RepID=A0ABQ6E5A3_9GAMM|nr:PilC/PilY family type IV pilus protein [Psychromonas marina]GLS92598.1 pilus biosynthesis protein [Psychromonas marina]
MNKLFTKTSVAMSVMMVTTVCFMLPTVKAGKLELPTAPLVTTKSVKPNMMLLLDSSSSMYSIVVEEKTTDSAYDSSKKYFTCPASRKLNSYQYSMRIKADGSIYLNESNGNTNSEKYYFGSHDGESCFEDDKSYKVRLYTDITSGGLKTTSSYGAAVYSGHYLNWYFSEGSFDEYRRAGTRSRMEMAQDAAIDLVAGLENIRVGLAIYDNSKDSDGTKEGAGAKILVNIGDIGEVDDSGDTAAQRNTIINKIKEIDAVGFTPLGESLMDMGHYFTINENGDHDLILHPESSPISKSSSQVFINGPAYQSISKPTKVIENWCQQSFVVAMTDGLPSYGRDINISSYLQNYASDDGTSEYADDVVKGMFDIDLRPDFSEAKNNVTTYMVGFSDPQVIGSQLIKNMANYGVGAATSEDNLLVASSGEELEEAFTRATDRIFAKVAAGSGVSFNSAQLSADSSIYAATFNSLKWSGSLQGFELSKDGSVSKHASWDAAKQLDDMDYTERKIFSYNSDTKKGIEFKSVDNISRQQKQDLEKGPKGNDETSINSLINYLRGDRDNEGESTSDYRGRDSALGDIVNSTLVYVGTPQLNWPNNNINNKFGSDKYDYVAFKNNLTANPRTPMLYVGANDGMLHGFNAKTGKEEFAYIPASIASAEDNAGLHYLAQSDYAHRFYVDATPTVSDVFINGEWRTILVGGLRAGGKGLFALDITNPNNFTSTAGNAQALALWEFSNTDDADFGYSYSPPTIAMMENGRWAVIIGNGYNSDNGTANLFILYIEEGSDGSWVLGDDYLNISTGVGSVLSPNGLATPRAVDINGDGVVDRIYAGDLQGNMWAFDVSSEEDSEWGVAYQYGSTPKPLFTAKDDQPITSAPIVAKSTGNTNDTGLLVFFGTGKYLEEEDKNTTQIMSYYGVLDSGNAGAKTVSDLTSRKVISSINGRAISGEEMNWNNSHGWYVDLTDNGTGVGERVTSNSLIRNGILLFGTIIPNIENNDDCVSNSESWLMGLDLSTGKAPRYALFNANSDGSLDDTNSIQDPNNSGNRITFSGMKLDGSMIAGDIALLSSTVYNNDVDGELNTIEINIETDGQEGRLSWEELIKK